MQFALLIYQSPEAFAARKSDASDPYTGLWRAYYKALLGRTVEASDAYDRAIGLAEDPAVREFLLQKRG